ncbi:MAG TPA: cardiolipin synthase [Bauldia sp.]|nr:cardiolipin synthase [Bauldia sp.]
MPAMSLALFLVHWLIIVAVGERVVVRRPDPGVALAWLFLAVLVPYVGGLAYLLIGERRVDPRRERAIRTLQRDYRTLFDRGTGIEAPAIDWLRHRPEVRGLDALGRTFVGSETVGGSAWRLYSTTAEALAAIVADIDAAKASVVMEFYIWADGGDADRVAEALVRAAGRGVSCRVLVDAIGGRPWWRGKGPERLRAGGVEVLPALRVGPWRSVVGRTDLRLHRKIVVVDGAIAWTGSMNMVDPRFFKTDAGVGEWLDAMVRLEGPVVAPLAAVAIGDWMLESGAAIGDLVKSAGLRLLPAAGTADMQVAPTGPGATGDGLLQMLLALVNAAREELVVTTPYLVPDVSLLKALRGAAGRGVRVVIVVPERVDSVLTRHASRSYYDDLLAVGVAIRLYRKGLLHTKSITVDGALAMFGTANLDMRSLWLNDEVTLFAWDSDFANAVRALQQTYIDDCDPVDPAAWAKRPRARRFVDDLARLVSPLL